MHKQKSQHTGEQNVASGLIADLIVRTRAVIRRKEAIGKTIEKTAKQYTKKRPNAPSVEDNPRIRMKSNAALLAIRKKTSLGSYGKIRRGKVLLPEAPVSNTLSSPKIQTKKALKGDVAFFAELLKKAEAWRMGPGKDLMKGLTNSAPEAAKIMAQKIVDPTTTTEELDSQMVADALGAEPCGTMPRRRR